MRLFAQTVICGIMTLAATNLCFSADRQENAESSDFSKGYALASMSAEASALARSYAILMNVEQLPNGKSEAGKARLRNMLLSQIDTSLLFIANHYGSYVSGSLRPASIEDGRTYDAIDLTIKPGISKMVDKVLGYRESIGYACNDPDIERVIQELR